MPELKFKSTSDSEVFSQLAINTYLFTDDPNVCY